MTGRPPLPPAVVFNYADWQLWFPDFINVSEPYATSCFWRAGQMCQNNVANPVVINNCGNTEQLAYFLYLLTCHIVWLNAPQVNGLPNTSGSIPASPLVGRISQATEGSVSVSAEMPNQPQGAAYYQQTKFGIEYWAASAPYRTAVFTPGRAPPPRGYGFGFPRSRRIW